MFKFFREGWSGLIPFVILLAIVFAALRTASAYGEDCITVQQADESAAKYSFTEYMFLDEQKTKALNTIVSELHDIPITEFRANTVKAYSNDNPVVILVTFDNQGCVLNSFPMSKAEFNVYVGMIKARVASNG